uniref:Post-GPI attachment to proteins factor 3 n=1 Tax=Xenopsylla cheopis TaxID=163159 RepID=A0A6M2E006_XENCH
MILRCYIYFIVICLVFLLICQTEASLGDRSPYFGNCVKKCLEEKCINFHTFKDQSDTNVLNDLVQWHCNDDCRYNCMWKTVDSFNERKWSTPQFDGKWPFMRILCFQEFASVLFSFTNFYAVYYLYKKLRRRLTRKHPMYFVWNVFALISINGWIWSMIFHTRDVRFTEFMDYISAFAIILSYFYCLGMRVLVNQHQIFSVLFSLFCAIVLFNHAKFLSGNRIDYAYHMKITVTIATASILGWLMWCWFHKNKLPYVKDCIIFMFLSAIVGPVLELADFPPIFWIFDAHSLWHLSTTFVHVYFYRFMIEDSLHLSKTLPYKNSMLPERYIERRGSSANRKLV